MAFNNVPVNGWPQIKDLEKLDAIAQQIQNMPTFTSNDKAFLEDLPAYPATDGKRTLTATTTSGETSLSYEEIEAELPADPVSDGVRVLTATTTGGVTTLSYEEASSGAPDYSTTEHATGAKWIDGKDIYRKVFVFENVTASTATQQAHNITGLATVVKLYGVAVTDTSTRPLPYVDDAADYQRGIYVNATNVGINGYTHSAAISSAHVVMEYTKSESEV